MQARYVFMLVGAAGVVTALALGSACQQHTEMVLRVTTSFDCSQLANNRVAVRVGADVRTGPVQSTSEACANRNAGSLVITPSGADGNVTIDVMAALKPAALDGDGRCAEGTAGCIHARRSLRYLTHQAIEIPIELDDACAGKQCDPTETCFRGACVPSDCTASGTQCVLGGSDAGADGSSDGGTNPLSTLCGDMSDLQSGAPYPMSLGCGGGSAVSAEKGPAVAPTRETPVTLSDIADDAVIDKNNVAYLTTRVGVVDAIDLNAEPPRKLWSAKFSSQALNLVSSILAADGKMYIGSLSSIVPLTLTPDAAVGKEQLTSSNIRSDIGLGPGGLLTFLNANNEVETLRIDAGLAPGNRYPLGLSADYLHPVGFAGSIWIGATDGTVRKIAPSTMTELGRATLAGAGSYYVQVAAGPDGRLRAMWHALPQGPTNVASIDPTSLQIKWSKALPTPASIDADLLGVTLDGTTWLRSDNQSVTTYDANGAFLATFSAESVYGTFDAAGYHYSGDSSNSGALTAWTATGTRVWTTNIGRNLRIVIVGKGGTVLATAGDATAYVYRP